MSSSNHYIKTSKLTTHPKKEDNLHHGSIEFIKAGIEDIHICTQAVSDFIQ